MIRKRHNKVRLHLQTGPSIEGVLVGGGWKRDYIVWAPKVLDQEDATVTISGHVEVPRENVLFVQVLG